MGEQQLAKNAMEKAVKAVKKSRSVEAAMAAGRNLKELRDKANEKGKKTKAKQLAINEAKKLNKKILKKIHRAAGKEAGAEGLQKKLAKKKGDKKQAALAKKETERE